MTTGHAQDAEQPETGITPGDKGAFRDVLSKDHARRGKPPVHLVDMTPDERIARAKDLGLPKFRVKQLANHYFAGWRPSPRRSPTCLPPHAAISSRRSSRF